MVTYSFRFYSRSSYNFILCFILSRVDELNKLASSQCMGPHSSAGRALQCENAEATGSNPVEAPKDFFGLLRNCLIAIQLQWSCVHFNSQSLILNVNTVRTW